jgi:membrane-bound lytic murein transglycosylase C
MFLFLLVLSGGWSLFDGPGVEAAPGRHQEIGTIEDLTEDTWLQEKNRRDNEWSEHQKGIDLAWHEHKLRVERLWFEFKQSTRAQYVEYLNDYESRSTIDYKGGTLRVEALVTEDDMLSIDEGKEKIARHVESLIREPGPVLDGQIASGQTGETVTEQNVETFVEEEVKAEVRIESAPEIGKDNKKRIRIVYEKGLIPNHLEIRARAYLPLIDEYSGKWNLDPKLVLAIIHTESYFNPNARSPVGAIGLMQLMPQYGAKEADAILYKEPGRILSDEFLLDPEINIAYGTAYLNMLLDDYWERIYNATNRRYLAICSYNWGPENVRSRALARHGKNPNTMNENQLYAHLRRYSPRETSDYLERVTQRMPIYGPLVMESSH